MRIIRSETWRMFRKIRQGLMRGLLRYSTCSQRSGRGKVRPFGMVATFRRETGLRERKLGAGLFC